MNLFDGLKRQAFDVVTQTMGYNALWVGTIYTARVGYMDPTEAQELSGIDSWKADEPFMDYRVDFFPGLKELVDNKQIQYVDIEGVGYFSVKEVTTKFDGDTFRARLIAAEPPV